MTETHNSKPSLNGRWTKEQHQKFLLGLQLFGKNWKKIQGLIGSRSGSQIRSHAQKFFLKVQKECDPEENEQKQSVDPIQIISHACSQNEKSTEMSYFFQQIMKQSKGQSNFDFWNQFIDQKRDNSSITETYEGKRKGSFIMWDDQQKNSEKDSKGKGEPRKITKT